MSERPRPAAGSNAPGGCPRHAALLVASAATVLPLAWMVVASMRPGAEILANPLAWPEKLTLEPFIRAWQIGEFQRHFLASAVVSTASVTGIVLCGSLAGFGLARFSIPGGRWLYSLLLLGFLLPTEAIVLSLAGLTEKLGISGTWLALIGPYMAIELPTAVFIYRSFFVSIPQAFHEAAWLDGASTWQVYWRIFLPMAWPATAVVGIVSFLAVWNEFLLATLLVVDPDLQTMPAAFNAFYGYRRSDHQLILAGLTVYVLPAIVVYLVFNRVISRSVTEATLKG
ncbi:MAG: carbohydrate ABC transporter permease [Phycisphaerae bacterium]|nr:carbohydrate ABC transporter permease [Phycisphaerae bacterium]